MSFRAAAHSFDHADLLPSPPVEQSGAYAVILDDQGRVLTVRAPNGRCYLPGGRIERGETARQALVREIGEECGWSAAILSPLRQSTQEIMGGEILLRTSHWRARLLGPLGTTPEYRPDWLPVEEAAASFHRDADRAALRAAVKRQPPGPATSRAGTQPSTCN
jgi:8-oxo-dGTP pyrophosphatase MutT (NUDIX family)